jgi:hypothetical protein
VLGSLIVGSVAYGYGTSGLDLTDEEIALIHPGSSTASHETATPYERVFAEWVTPAPLSATPTTGN